MAASSTVGGAGGRPAKRSHAEVPGEDDEDDEDERRCAEAVREYMTRVEPRWLKRSNVERRCVDTLSREEFVEKYEKPRIPVILTGVVSKWLAATEWTRKRLLERFGEKTFRVSASVDMTLREYLEIADRSEAQHELRPLYLFDKDFCSKCPEMVAEFSVPPYFEEDLMDVLGAERPDYKWLIIGPRLTGSSFHVDPNCNFAWNATIEGRKKWVLYPPDCPPPSSGDDDRQLCLPQWFREHYDADEHVDRRLECVTEAGECMFVPRGWWHCVLNLEMTVAITHNVVTSHNLLAVLDFLEQDAPCAPGEGCRGTTKFNLSGDVPTSVIYPYPSLMHRPLPAEQPEPQQDTGKSRSGALSCSCQLAQSKLLRDFRAGLEREHSGLVERLLKERAATRAKSASPFVRHAPPVHGGAVEQFSFGGFYGDEQIA